MLVAGFTISILIQILDLLTDANNIQYMAQSKSRKLQKQVIHEEKLQEFKANQAVFNALEKHEEITTDTVVKEAGLLHVAPEYIVHFLPRLFRRFANPKAMLMEKTGRHVVSQRPRREGGYSQTVPVYRSLIFKGQKSNG